MDARNTGGYGTRTPEEGHRHDLTILDIFETAASVKLGGQDWIDHLQVAKFDGRRVIVSVLWQLKPEAVHRRG